MQVGEISCTQHWVVTPIGSYPLAGCTFLVRDNLHHQRRIPPYAIVLAVLFFWLCLLGLLFLLIQEDIVTGSVEVSVTGEDGLAFYSSVPIGSTHEADDVRRRVDYCRNLVRLLG